MGLIVLWFRYMHGYSDRYNEVSAWRAPFHMYHAMKENIGFKSAWELKQCAKVDRAVDKIDLASHFLKFNKLDKALETIEAEEIQDKEVLDSFKNKLERRIKLEELRSFLISYRQFLEKTV